MGIELSFIKDVSIIIGGIVTLFMFINGLIEYRKQGKQRRVDHFVMLRRRLKENPVFSEISLFLDNDDPKLKEISPQNKRDFLGLLEEVALLHNSRFISRELAYYMFGYYAIACVESKNFWANFSVEKNNKYWQLFFDFAKKAKEFNGRFKINKLRF